jgi:catechol 2,3-dioxygenase-like lactoylglutathione lyase family enzyme
MEIQLLHHVSLPVSDLDRSHRFYTEILGLEEIARPDFPFGGKWYRLGTTQELHLILQHTDVTYRAAKGIDPGDIHLAIRVKSYQATVEFLCGHGYREDAGEKDVLKLRTNPHSTTGYPQIYILDPDRHLIEINAAALD